MKNLMKCSCPNKMPAANKVSMQKKKILLFEGWEEKMLKEINGIVNKHH